MPFHNMNRYIQNYHSGADNKLLPEFPSRIEGRYQLAVEASWSYMKGNIGKKSAEVKKRQKNMPQEVVTYADKASIRCQRKYHRLTSKGKDSNKAVTAVARELCCFIWGMATSHYEGRTIQPKDNSELKESALD